MGFRIKIDGSTTIELKEQSITSVKFRADIPKDSNARSTDLGSTVEITGKILTAVDGVSVIPIIGEPCRCACLLFWSSSIFPARR